MDYDHACTRQATAVLVALSATRGEGLASVVDRRTAWRFHDSAPLASRPRSLIPESGHRIGSRRLVSWTKRGKGD